MKSPLGRLWKYAGPYRSRVVKATTFSVFNKLADVLPELVIGAAVDVVVRGADSLVGRTFGIADRFGQLMVLAGINFAIW
ncbi:MAG: ABC transporter, partial [Acidimicrobiia bacterium]